MGTSKLSNAALDISLSEVGSYRGTRFDWSGIIESLKFDGFEFFGKWNDCADAEFHDAISGTPEEFVQIGYDAVPAGADFLKIGVGMLLKPDDKPYDFRRKYEISNFGVRETHKNGNSIMYVHELKDKSGYAYRYEKTLSIDADSARMTIAHRLENAGLRNLETSVYDHNFFTLGGEGMSPGISVKFPFDLKGERIAGIGSLVEIKNGKAEFLKKIPDGEFALLKNIATPDKIESYDIVAEKFLGANKFVCRITSDRPNSKMNFWTCPTCVCPEPFIDVKVPSGGAFEWRIFYDFYKL